MCLNPCTPVSTTVKHASPTEIAKSNYSNLNEHLQTDTLSLPQSTQPISPSHSARDQTHYDIKYLEQLLDSTVAVIPDQYPGHALADDLNPRAYDTFKARYALVALDSSITPRGSDTPTLSTVTFSDIGNNCLYSNNRSPPFPKSNLAVPRSGKIHVHISISAEYVMHFSWAELAAVCCLLVYLFLRIFMLV